MQNTQFLPDGYEVPKGKSSYMKFEQGPNKFRFLSAPIIGWEYWALRKDENGKEVKVPVRARECWNTIPVDADISGKNGWDPKHFWAMVVWNHQTKAIEILEITQKGILVTMQNRIKDPEWGDPREYNFTVTRTGTGLDTEYDTTANPPSKLPAEIKQLYENATIDLALLFEGKDPFKAEARGDIDPKEFKPAVVQSNDEGFAEMEASASGEDMIDPAF